MLTEEEQRAEVAVHEREIRIAMDPFVLVGTLALPDSALGMVLFAHGSGSSRTSPRNRFVAFQLHRGRFGTLLLDLLTPEEEKVDDDTEQHRFDIELLAGRLAVAIDWLRRDQRTGSLPIGLFGASTGAAAALVAASERPHDVAAVVCRGGRVDLAGPAVAGVRAPTLLIAGADDELIVEINDLALDKLGAETKQLEVVPGASHLFEEPGKLEEVARLTRDWFDLYLL